MPPIALIQSHVPAKCTESEKMGHLTEAILIQPRAQRSSYPDLGPIRLLGVLGLGFPGSLPGCLFKQGVRMIIISTSMDAT